MMRTVLRMRAISLCIGAFFLASIIVAVTSVEAQDAAGACPIPSGISGQSAAFFKQLMAKDDADAGAILGALYSEGVSGSISKDTAKSFACYRWAAERGNALGQSELGAAYLNGQFVAKDPVQAADWLRKAAEQNVQLAQFDLGKMYEQGNGVAEDKVEALKWYLLAAKPRKGNNPVKTGEANYMARQLETSLSPEDAASANERAAAFVPVGRKKASP